MAKADKRKIETSAVNAVERVFCRAKRIDTLIEKNDKTPCIDGNLQVYSSEQMLKENLKGIIDVQVKGTTKKINSSTPKCAVEVADLQAYLNVFGGVLYFMVFLTPNLDVRGIYYKQLLPYDLRKLFEEKIKEGQKTVTLRFVGLPDNPAALEKICDEFLWNQERQKTAKYVGFESEDDFEKNGIEIKEFQFGRIIVDTPAAASLKSWSNGSYKYAIGKDGQEYVFNRMEPPIEIAAGFERRITSGDFDELITVFVGEDQSSKFLEFGAFKIRFGKKTVIQYTPTGSFRGRWRDARLMREILLTGQLSIEGAELCKNISRSASDLAELNEQVKQYQSIVDVLDKLRVKVDWDPERLTEHEARQISKLVAALTKNEQVPLVGIDENAVNLNIDIQGSRIKIIAQKQEEGFYRFYDPFSEKMTFAVDVSTDLSSKRIVPVFLLFNEEDFQLAANIDVEVFVQSLGKRPIDVDISDLACDTLLRMLRAYDAGAVCSKELLDCALVLAEYLLEVEHTAVNAYINKAQVLKRGGSLSAEEKRKLRDVSMQKDNKMAQFCAFLLLDMQDYAKDIFEEMTEEERYVCKSWPIMKFYKEQ